MRALFLALAIASGLAVSARAEPKLAAPGLTQSIEREEDVSEIQMLVGAPTAILFGFGTGHAIEGRWREKGWIFTLGETAGFATWMSAYMLDMSCTRHCGAVGPLAAAGLLSVVGLRLWESVDAITGARAKNRRVLKQRAQLGLQLATPSSGDRGMVVGISLH